MRPPIARISRAQTNSPIPAPAAAEAVRPERKNSSNTFSASSGGKPGPSSLIVTLISCSVASAVTRTIVSRAAVLRGVREQVPDDLFDIRRIRDRGRQPSRQVDVERHARPARLLRTDDGGEHPLDEDRLRPDLSLVLAEARHRDDVLDQPVEALRLDDDVGEDLATGFLRQLIVLAGEDLRAREDRRHRRSQLVRQDADERVPDGLALPGGRDVAEHDDRLAVHFGRVGLGRGRPGSVLSSTQSLLAAARPELHRAAGRSEARGLAVRVLDLGEDLRVGLPRRRRERWPRRPGWTG